MLKLLLAGSLLTTAALTASAQTGIKTNLAGWASTTTNIAVEADLSRRATVQLAAYLNPWDFGGDSHFRFWTAQPEFRYWFCEAFNGHFIGLHALAGEYNAKRVNFPLRALTWGGARDINDNFPEADHAGAWPDITGDNAGRHVEGWYLGAGLSYGYQWVLSRHWNFEASVGVGFVFSPLTYYGRCQQTIDRRAIHYVGPTNAQLSFIYLF